ncbi:MAG: hypothetical protein ABUL62_14610 [Myxococcales bacterium]|jgi:hypothetical protein
MLKLSSHLLFAGFVACAGCSSAVAQPEAATAQEAPRASVDGVFERYLVSPRGDVDGILLKDGTTARFAPHLYVASSEAKLNVGDQVHVDGDVLVVATGRVIEHSAVKKGTIAVALSEQSATPPVAPPTPPPIGAEDGLQEMATASRISKSSGPRTQSFPS